MIHMEYYLVVSTIMMFAGIYGFFTRRNTLAILISVELMLNATDINFAVFNRFLFPEGMEGYFFALFSIAISAAETAVAIAIMINIYRNLVSHQEQIIINQVIKIKLYGTNNSNTPSSFLLLSHTGNRR